MGPAMAAKTLDGETEGSACSQEEVLDTLRKILAKIEA
jgi:hypothetical protein